MISLVILFLGGPKPEKMGVDSIKAPGAYNHSRWMSKVLYTLKMTLFRYQIGDVYAPENFENIHNLGQKEANETCWVLFYRYTRFKK